MEAFVDEVIPDERQAEAYRILNGRKPFANFKYLVEGDGDLRDPWFEFRTQWHMRMIERQLQAEEFDIGSRPLTEKVFDPPSS